MKTDSIFYRLFQEIPSIFFELIGNSPEEANKYQFSSVEVKQTSFRLDGVFLPIQTVENPIYFVEVQFQADGEIYSRLFAEVCLYLRQNQPQNDWSAVVLYPTRSIDISSIKHYQEFFTSERVRRIYLDELGESTSLPIGIATIKLIIANEDQAIAQGKELIRRTKQEINSQRQQQLLQLIETILVYKLPQMSREDIEAMFGLSELKQTRFYQEAFQEGEEEGERKGKLKAVPPMLAAGLTVEQIAAALELSVEDVRQATQKPDND
ncbi:Rpn family recombination-promoting nuclease/putative transposase [Nodularia harveyana UHCC-0300]|uniref:Rpn family recombination-promoting nuclease/putative transposase n=1 Tax=Nodularia harveyana UHCC-0300 TaxID=2974287 RepID=A0ABU5U978_9CYAN|nr:Rpn family recombination-promoting nuclease/putative transposase [Nodularia harveyana]MEA5579720.1 Rpn family recombination-promoting nuclease/putative transposase [Nodularia harveyana UHCC-0300]